MTDIDHQKAAMSLIIHSKSILNDTDYDTELNKMREEVMNWIFINPELKSKILGMCYRNYIPQGTEIEFDVLQEVMIHLWKYDALEMLLMWCDNPRRVLALAITISSRVGFCKINNGEHPNQSVAKKILFASNFKKYDNIDNEGSIENIWNDNKIAIAETFNSDAELWNLIRENLNADELEFLRFIIENVYSKKRVYFGRELRKQMSFNEYKINFLILKNRIKDIIKKNKINGYGKKDTI